MTRLVTQHREIEAQILSLQSQLTVIERDPLYAKEVEFEEKLVSLLDEYGKDLRDVTQILDPEAESPQPRLRGPRPGTLRPTLIYKNPNTGEVIESGSGNNRILKKWKAEYPSVDLKEWVIGEK